MRKQPLSTFLITTSQSESCFFDRLFPGLFGIIKFVPEVCRKAHSSIMMKKRDNKTSAETHVPKSGTKKGERVLLVTLDCKA